MEEIKLFLAEYKRHWHILINPGPDRGTGAVVILIKKDLFPANAIISTESYAPGRILRTQVHSILAERRFCAIIWNVHNFDLGADQVQNATQALERDVHTSKTKESTTVLAAGDWNFLAPGEVMHSVVAPSSSPPRADSLVKVRPFQSRWQAVLNKLLELDQPEMTHYNVSSLTVARIDRIYSSTAS